MKFEEEVTRREMLELLGRAAALPMAGSFFAAWGAARTHAHGASDAPPQPDFLRHYQPKFFAPEDFAALAAFTEILIPTDEEPGAKEAYCAQFIDFVLQASEAMPQTQGKWRVAMKALKDAGFHDADARRLEIVKQMARPETDQSAVHPAYFAYRLIKQQTAFAFYTSRVGMIDVLDYKGNSYNLTFPACTHPEHQTV